MGLSQGRDPSLVPGFVSGLRLPPSGDGIAVFDADGTLWVNDVADDFTSWMMATGRIPSDLWPEYLRIYRDDAPAGCRFLLRMYTGLTHAELRVHLEEWWRNHAHRKWIPEVVESLHHLVGSGLAIWVVSGTPTDFLLPLADVLPIDAVVGMDFDVDAVGRFTGRHSGISCAAEGKAEKILSLASGRPIVFCCGNGSLDAAMMEIADLQWSVYPNREFEAYSRARGWPVLPRPPGFVEEAKFLG